MGDDGTAVGDELLGVPLPFSLFGLQAENLKVSGGDRAHWETVGLRLSSTGDCPTADRHKDPFHCNGERLHDRCDGLLHLIGGSRFLARFVIVTAVRFSSLL